MKIKRLSAAVMAAAVLAVAAPVTGVLPNPLGMTSSASEYKAGDVFYAGLAEDGTVPYIVTAEEYEADPANLYGVYQCTVKSDGTIKIGCHGAITPYPQFGKTLTIPSEINGYTVTELGTSDKYSFGIFGCKKVVIPDTVTTIGESAFWKSCFLEEVEFGVNSRLKLIDQWSFQDCRSLKSITIPASVETIMEGAFGNTDQKLDGFYDRDQNTDLDFTDTYSLTTVNFTEGSKLKLIDQWALQGQEALKSITLPDSLEKIGYGAFNHCTALTKINVPKNVNEIGAFAFQISGWNNESGSITEITVDENNPNFKSVDGVVFSKDGKTIVAYPVAKSGKYEIPADVNTIAEAAFASCPKLTSVTIPEGVTDIPENAFSYCTSLAEVKLPSTLKTIAKWGFEATALTSIDIPESVTAIDAHAFESSSLKQINGVAYSYAETFA
ncbi:MAG: leucine-rich repeat domain-containing protein, partial [Oscillospiraceae bacterium]|nr:leucine-rich repeat domain-containing protein [Oscillospiraceae bacterium]